MSQEFSILLDLIRAIASSIVSFGHLRGGLFPAYAQLPIDNQTPVNFFLFFVTRLGMESVIIFFVLSGYLVGGGALIELREQKFKLSDYIIKRLSRMYTVVIPALFLGGICDISRIIFTDNQHLIENLNIINFISNFFFLQVIITPTFGSNLPLWTLSFEFWYYIIWAFLIMNLIYISRYRSQKQRRHLILSFANFVIFVTIISCTPAVFLQYFPIFILGSLTRIIPIHKTVFLSNKTKLKLLIVSIFIMVIAILYSSLKRQLIAYYFLAFCTSFFILQISSLESPYFRKICLKIKQPTKLFADFSFSLYALHYPLQILLLAILPTLGILQIPLKNADVLGWVYFLLLMILVYTYSYMIYFFTERHTIKVRNFMFYLRDIFKYRFHQK